MTTHLLFTVFIVVSSGGLVCFFVKGLLEKAHHFDEAVRAIRQWPSTMGQAVTVYYDPANPSDALLRQNQADASQYRSGAYALIFFWLFIVTTTVFGMIATV